MHDLNLTIPDLNLTKPDLNLTIPDLNLTIPDLNPTIPDLNPTKPDLNLTKPDLNLTKPDLNLTKPRQVEKMMCEQLSAKPLFKSQRKQVKPPFGRQVHPEVREFTVLVARSRPAGRARHRHMASVKNWWED
eukprot:4098702-Pyramimonas_sp.AAC.3